jgi:hypothetical protein
VVAGISCRIQAVNAASACFLSRERKALVQILSDGPFDPRFGSWVRVVSDLATQLGQDCPAPSYLLLNQLVPRFERRGFRRQKFEMCPRWGAN